MNPDSFRKSLPIDNGITVKDVAARAGVSTATVSRVLSGKEGVSPELEQRVRQVIDELAYRPNQAARRLRERRSKIIGVLVPDIQINFFASIVVSIERELQKAGYLLLLGNTYDDLESEKQHIDTFLSEDVAGVIFAPSTTINTSNYRPLQEAGVHLVAIDRQPGEMQIDTVQIDNTQAALRATRHLIEEGHQQIGFIAGSDLISTSIDRQLGYELALRQAGIAVNPELIRPGSFSIESGYQAMKVLFANHRKLSAVLIANNSLTLGAMKYVRECEIDVPTQIAIIGFDDMPWSTILRPPLSVIVQPVNEIGISAARLMLDRINEPKSSIKHLTLETTMVIRQSCLCAASAKSKAA